MTPIVLASGSATRRALLANAGVQFTARTPGVDERELEAPLLAGGSSADDIATALAHAKAVDVSRDEPGALVIGADQTLEFDGNRWTKPRSFAEAREQLARLSGHTHTLHSAMAVARDGQVEWLYLASAALNMRVLSATYIDAYLARIGPAALTSVGVYQFEGEGIQLFERIDGDYFTILGLPLMPLLKYLRSEGAIE